MKYNQLYQNKQRYKDGIMLYNHIQKEFFLNTKESEIYEYFNGVNTVEQIAHAVYPLYYSSLTKEEFIETFNNFIIFLITNHLLKQNNH